MTSHPATDGFVPAVNGCRHFLFRFGRIGSRNQQLLGEGIEFTLPCPPVRTVPVKQAIKALAVVVFDKVAKLVDQHVLHAVGGGFDQ